MEQNWFVEKRLLVIVRDQPIAGGKQFASGFGVMRFVRIPEARHSEPPEQHDEEHYGPCDVGPAVVFCANEKRNQAGDAPMGMKSGVIIPPS